MVAGRSRSADPVGAAVSSTLGARSLAAMSSSRLAFIGIGVILAAFVAWLAFGFFGIQAAFLDDEVDEANPFETTDAAGDGTADGDASGSPEAEEAIAEAQANPTEVDESTEDAMGDETEIQTLFTGEFSGTDSYDITGNVLVITDGTQTFLRFEDFESDNGPDLKVYLRAENGEFRSLGDLKGNIGDQNYEIPSDIDLSVFSTVQVWCERFSALFGDAPLI